MTAADSRDGPISWAKRWAKVRPDSGSMTSSSPRRLPVMSGACVAAFRSRSWAVDIPGNVVERSQDFKNGQKGAAWIRTSRGAAAEAESAAANVPGTRLREDSRQDRRVTVRILEGVGIYWVEIVEVSKCGCAAERTR